MYYVICHACVRRFRIVFWILLLLCSFQSLSVLFRFDSRLNKIILQVGEWFSWNSTFNTNGSQSHFPCSFCYIYQINNTPYELRNAFPFKIRINRHLPDPQATSTKRKNNRKFSVEKELKKRRKNVKMLAQPTKLCNFSPEYLAAARFYEYHQHSPTTAIALTPPYEHKYNFVPIYTNSPPKVFDDFDKYGRAFTPLSLSSSSSPSDLQLRAMQLPLTPPLSNTPPPQLASVSPPVFWPSNYGLSEVAKPSPPPNMDVQRTHSVIMKVEDQRIVEIPARELNHRPSSSESEDEIIVCKWRKCYR